MPNSFPLVFIFSQFEKILSRFKDYLLIYLTNITFINTMIMMVKHHSDVVEAMSTHSIVSESVI